ncbi:hypothetical protein L6452_19109 [Arctium lappa]|uniref:Uncharacterized protein n=1 Tax=Arctium lappa TaxID=4217 RepID=A0ACB9B731_ARCLA|nr:hypothetical protein L6452_19109 [Arctium lappa]
MGAMHDSPNPRTEPKRTTSTSADDQPSTILMSLVPVVLLASTTSEVPIFPVPTVPPLSVLEATATTTAN